jgi:hypothetical protein
MDDFLTPMRRTLGMVTLSVTLLIAQTAVAQATAASELSPRRKIDLLLFDPTPKDWEQIHDHEAIKILQIYDIREEGSRVDDRSLETLSQFKNLKTLVIGCDQLTDEAIPQLLKLKHLEGLAVYRGKFTDQGIQKLKGLPAIQTIGFFNTQVTERGITLLKEVLPKAHVELGKYNQFGKVFDHNGCLATEFRKKHLKVATF